MQGNMFSGLNMSNEDRIFTHLIENGTINNNMCVKTYGIKDISSYIRNLKKKNIVIYCVKKVGINEDFIKKYWVDYILAPPHKQLDKTNRIIDYYRESVLEKQAV